MAEVPKTQEQFSASGRPEKVSGLFSTMNVLRSVPYCVLVILICIQSCTDAQLKVDEERLKQLVQTCVEAQIAAGNTNVFSPDRSIDDHTLVFAGVSYLPDGLRSMCRSVESTIMQMVHGNL
jgi:hypothetical protein